eukprot:CAMPEP_0185778044 /NCGR_PEP_ID=MMETSP1174-20130828/91402_1 /TAXON_ID=35687 /ORGANISM="Dictyocha speculum, Strain CCMP1381" /LENGTH=357 /DNA_ID=CAMNT_0028466633 /DNA_START=59 /DNA_END=1132 /DNA_ORIENTATION=+
MSMKVVGQVEGLPILQRIGRNTHIFLKNVDKDVILGVFNAAEPARMNIRPDFLRGSCPLQVALKETAVRVELDTQLPFDISHGPLNSQRTTELIAFMSSVSIRSEDVRWQCVTCTYHNSALLHVCEICESSIPKNPWLLTSSQQLCHSSSSSAPRQHQPQHQPAQTTAPTAAAAVPVVSRTSPPPPPPPPPSCPSPSSLPSSSSRNYAATINHHPHHPPVIPERGSGGGAVREEDEEAYRNQSSTDQHDNLLLPTIPELLAELKLPLELHAAVASAGYTTTHELLSATDEQLAAVGVKKGPRVKLMRWARTTTMTSSSSPPPPPPPFFFFFPSPSSSSPSGFDVEHISQFTVIGLFS